jgi:LuxR family transcriptional regulator, maltose regulon positive regulatory protein
MASLASNAKTRPPCTANSIPRERLFAQLDAVKTHPALWLSAPAGYGKTLLMASYVEHRSHPCLWYQLDPADNDPAFFFSQLDAASRFLFKSRKALPTFSLQHLPNLPVFARNFFQALSQRIPPTGLLVFDDYHEVPANSPLHTIFRYGLNSIPPYARVVILSRGAPPPDLARHISSNRLTRFPSDALRFSLEESMQLMANQAHAIVPHSNEEIQALHARTEGWAAGFMLSLAHQGKTSSGLSRENLFDYFAGEILDRLDPAIEDFLKQTALFPEFTSGMAQRLTGARHAERLLTHMVRNNQFITLHGENTYRYHDLFRQCLLERAQRSFTEQRLKNLHRAAADILLAENFFHQSFRLLADAELWDEAASLVKAHAGQLAEQGQLSTLADWIAQFPLSHLEADTWLLFWNGTAHLPLQGPRAARAWFERAYKKFLPGEDGAGIYLSWCGVIESYLFEWHLLKPLDPWLADLQHIRTRFPLYPHPDIGERVVTAMFSALCFRHPTSKEIEYWTREAEKIQQTSANSAVRLILVRQLLYWWGWKGYFHKFASLLEEYGKKGGSSAKGSLLDRIHIRIMLVFAYWVTGKPNDAMTVLKEAFQEVERDGIPALYHLLLSTAAFLHFDQGQLEEGRQYVDRMEVLLSEHVLEIGNYHYMRGLEMAHRGNRPAALRHVDISLRKTFLAGTPLQACFSLLAKGQILLEMELFGKSDRVLRRARQLARRIDSAWLLARYELIKAELCFARGDFQEADKHLHHGFTLCREHRIMHFEWWIPETMARLCARALAACIETEFVLEMVRTNNLAEKAPPLGGEEWPWLVRIYALGRFEIVIDEQKLVSSGKIQKKPLELLKALISLGGQEVHENQLIDCLWPDAEGDLGHNALSVTLARLRRLLGHEQALLFQGGRLSIDPRYCWVDGIALERLLEDGARYWKGAEGGSAAPSNDFARAVGLTEKALSLYRGHFLPGETAIPWTISIRERLRGKFIRGVARLGEHWEKAGELEKAADCYLQGLERDDLVEEFYQRLMLIYHRLGRTAMGVEIYRRCRLRLASSLGLSPCAETEAIQLRLLG